MISLFPKTIIMNVLMAICLSQSGADAFPLQYRAPRATCANTNTIFSKMERHWITGKPQRRSLVEVRGNRRIEDEDKEPQEKLSSILSDRIHNIDVLEVRLDATLASCYGLCRFLIFDLTTGAKDVPGWQLNDFIMLGGAFSSCISLACLWSVVGIAIGTFNDHSAEYDLFKIILNAFIAGPIWLLLEVAFGWPPGGLIVEYDFTSLNIMGLLTHVATGSTGLASIMCFGKVYTTGWK